MLFLPFYFRRKLFLGVPIAINILAGVYLLNIKSLLKKNRPTTNHQQPITNNQQPATWFLVSYFLLASWTTFWLITTDIRGMLKHELPYFISKEVMASYHWLSAQPFNSSAFKNTSHITHHSLHGVLAHPDNGVLIPVYSRQKVYASKWLWTENLPRKKINIKKFFRKDTSDTWRKQFLEKNNISYVYYGPLEKQVGDFSPDQTYYLKRVFDKSHTQIFEILPDKLR